MFFAVSVEGRIAGWCIRKQSRRHMIEYKGKKAYARVAIRVIPCNSPRFFVSMVINCIPTAKQRGEMLKGYRKHLRPGGHLFLMLPVLCLTKSTRTTRASFEETLKAVGFRIRETRDSPKVAFFCAMAVEENPREADSRGDRCGSRNMTGSARLEDQQGVGTSQGRNKRSNRGCNDFEVVL